MSFAISATPTTSPALSSAAYTASSAPATASAPATGTNAASTAKGGTPAIIVTLSDQAQSILAAQANASSNYYAQFFPTRDGSPATALALAVTPPEAESSSNGKSLQQVAADVGASMDAIRQTKAMYQNATVIVQRATTSVSLGDTPSPTAKDGSAPPINALQSAEAQNAEAQSALRQLTQINNDLRRSNHDAGAQKLQQLLKQFGVLRLLRGALSPRQLAELARDIAAAARDVAAGDGGPAIGVDVSSGSSVVSTTALSDTGSAVGAVAGNATDAAGATEATPTGSVTPGAAAAQAATPSTSDPKVTSSGAVLPPTLGRNDGQATASPPGATATDLQTTSASERQALLNKIETQGARGLAQAQGKAADQSLLQQAANAVSAVQGMIKQAEENERHKHKSATNPDFDWAKKVVNAAAATITKAQVDISRASSSVTPSAAVVTGDFTPIAPVRTPVSPSV
jgi:hypothetical protein